MKSQPPERTRIAATADILADTGPADLPLAKLRSLRNQLRRSVFSLPEKHPWRDHLTTLWLATARAIDAREIEAAERADAGQVLWAVSTLRQYQHHDEFIRTPRRFIHRSIYSDGFFGPGKSNVTQSVRLRNPDSSSELADDQAESLAAVARRADEMPIFNPIPRRLAA